MNKDGNVPVNPTLHNLLQMVNSSMEKIESPAGQLSDLKE